MIFFCGQNVHGFLPRKLWFQKCPSEDFSSHDYSAFGIEYLKIETLCKINQIHKS